VRKKKKVTAAVIAEGVAVDKKKTLGIRIAVVLVIILVIAGIFIFKTVSKEKETNPNTASQSQNGRSTSYPLKITKTDLEEIKAYGIPTVIDFGSDSCKPCKAMAPVLETLNEEWQGKAAVQFMDVWKYTDGVDDFPVSVIPTQAFFNADGTPYVPSDSIQNSIEGLTMYTDKTTGEHVFTVHQGGITEEEMRQIFAEMGVE
jgi:thioredoxin 1